jgi:hypothetical protein
MAVLKKIFFVVRLGRDESGISDGSQLEFLVSLKREITYEV